MMESIASQMSSYLALASATESCANRNCDVCDNIKACAACGLISYCCKEHQSTDWPRHKVICKALRPLKLQVAGLNLQLKQVLDRSASEIIVLPSIDEDCASKYRGDGVAKAQLMWVQGGLTEVKKMLKTNISNLLKTDSSQQSLLKRWQEISPALFRFVELAEIGDVFKEKGYHPYSPGAPQQFRNSPSPDYPVLTNGKSMVEIGFVDFGISFEGIDSLAVDGPPLTVVGYEMEAQCVAKTRIMILMMKDPRVNAQEVLEVWLNSLWSKSTFAAFKRATKKITKGDDGTIEPSVMAIVKYWDCTNKISARAAIRFQMQAVLHNPDTTFAMECCSMTSRDDRIAFLHYYFTKALYEDNTTTIGSVVMNSTNEKIGVKQLFAKCTEAAPYNIHMSCDPNFDKNIGVIGRVKKYFKLKMEKYIRCVRSGALSFTPKLGNLSPDNASLIGEVTRMQPYIISWSNVVDYISPSSFHSIARRMSCDDTAHYMHSCNWSSWVLGTDVFDLSESKRLHCYAGGLFTIETGLTMMDGFSKQGAFHFRDICTVMLGRKHVNKFFRYFFDGKEVNCSCLNGNTPLKTPYPLARSPDTAFVVFAYKETGITFGQDAYDFNKCY